MLDADLLLSLAEIAGVFVAFGALLAVRSGAPTEAGEIAPVRAVLMAGMATIIAALAPVALGRYGLAAHSVLALSSILVIGTYAGLLLIHVRAPEYRASAAALRGHSQKWLDVVESLAMVVIVGGPMVALLAIALGLVAEFEEALYITAVALFLVQAAWTLLWHVFRRRGSGP